MTRWRVRDRAHRALRSADQQESFGLQERAISVRDSRPENESSQVGVSPANFFLGPTSDLDSEFRLFAACAVDVSMNEVAVPLFEVSISRFIITTLWSTFCHNCGVTFVGTWNYSHASVSLENYQRRSLRGG